MRFERDVVELSEVYNAFESLKEEIENMHAVPEGDKAILEAIRKKR